MRELGDELRQRVVQALDQPDGHQQSRSVPELTPIDESRHADRRVRGILELLLYYAPRADDRAMSHAL
jgi:hypothetical protein